MFRKKEWFYMDDEFIPTDEETKIQIDTAKELIDLVEKYLKEYNK